MLHSRICSRLFNEAFNIANVPHLGCPPPLPPGSNVSNYIPCFCSILLHLNENMTTHAYVLESLRSRESLGGLRAIESGWDAPVTLSGAARYPSHLHTLTSPYNSTPPLGCRSWILSKNIYVDSHILTMDGVQKELDRLKKKAPGIAGPSTSSKAAALNPTIHDSLDRLIAHLERARGALPSSSDSASSSSQSTAQTRMELSRALERTQREVSERQKEYHAALARLGKALDRKFPTNLAGVADPSLFTSPAAQGALERTVLDHLLRAGEWDAAAAFAKVSQGMIRSPIGYQQEPMIGAAYEWFAWANTSHLECFPLVRRIFWS